MKSFNAGKAIDGAVKYIESYVHLSGCSKVVLGVSGGKDSTVVAMLAVKALGKENVIGVIMPNGIQKDIDDAIEVCETLDITYVVRNINDIYDSFKYHEEHLLNKIGVKEANPEAILNVTPRIRMTMLYMVAAEFGNALVIGTGNLCERAVGYFTKYGDGGCDFNPIGLLTVNEVIAMGMILAVEFGLSQSLIVKTPEDGLSGISDEVKLGVSYLDIGKYVREQINEIDDSNLLKIIHMVNKSRHKRKMPPMYDYYSEIEEDII